MCGIAGWIGIFRDDQNYARRMMNALHHRGPDSNGVQGLPGATLIHTRLSILDLSPTGSQPMPNEDGTIWTVFNGEIYNHRDLRRDLEAKGHLFRGRSDTEVLPHLYEQEASQFVSKLRGMFAFALYDTRTKNLILARDRFGIKPLFYAAGKEGLAFASELRALLVLPWIDKRPDRQAVSDLTALSYIPAPGTFYRGIRALEPGEILEARLEREGVLWKTRKYHSWSIDWDHKITLQQATDRADELLRSAVERQLESDVPLGALLSGGIDSSLTSVAAQRALRGELRTFNVRFSDKEYDETWAAAMAAKHIGSHHETLSMTDSTAKCEQISALLSHAGQPFADTSLFAVNAISRLMRQRVTVAISGDGGDEAFSGYDVYWRVARIARWQALPFLVRESAGAALGGLSKLGIAGRRLSERMRALGRADDTSVIQSLFCFMTEREQKDLCRDPDVLPVRRFFERTWSHQFAPKTSREDRLAAHATEVNVRVTLPNDFLFKVDLASMKESLEVRVPMLDEELFAFGLSLPPQLKVKGRTGKRILREVAARHLPPAVANKPKWGFAVPLESWIGADLKQDLSEILLGPSSGLSEFFRPQVYRPLVDALIDGRSLPTISRQELWARAIMLLSVQLALSNHN